MMKVIIVHGSPSSKERAEEAPQNVQHWIPWLRKELEKKGFETFAPLMPESWDPKYLDWKKEFEKLSIDENTILIGHSAGGAFLVRWLNETKQKVKKLILVSPGKAKKWKTKDLSNLYGNKIIKKINNYVKEGITIFTARDDHDYHIEGAKEYEKELPAKLIILGKGYGHFTLKAMGKEEFPELLSELLRGA